MEETNRRKPGPPHGHPGGPPGGGVPGEKSKDAKRAFRKLKEYISRYISAKEICNIAQLRRVEKRCMKPKKGQHQVYGVLQKTNMIL